MKKNLCVSATLCISLVFASCVSTPEDDSNVVEPVLEETPVVVDDLVDDVIILEAMTSDPELIVAIPPDEVPIIEEADAPLEKEPYIITNPVVVEETPVVVEETPVVVEETPVVVEEVPVVVEETPVVVEETPVVVEETPVVVEETPVVVEETPVVVEETPVVVEETPVVVEEVPVVVEEVPVVVEEVPTIDEYLSLQKDKTVDFTLPGRGWIFLGEELYQNSFKKGVIQFVKRTIEKGNTRFVLKGIDEGSALIHFSKQDFIKNTFIHYYTKVTVGEKKIDDTKNGIEDDDIDKKIIVQPIQKKEESIVFDKNEVNENSFSGNERGLESSESGKTIVTKEPVLTIANSQNVLKEEKTVYDDMSSDELFDASLDAFSEKKYEECLNYLDAYFIHAVDDLDKAWFLRGKTFESPSSVKNIKKALEAYQKIIDTYPESPLYSDANERVRYITQFYYNIH